VESVSGCDRPYVPVWRLGSNILCGSVVAGEDYRSNILCGSVVAGEDYRFSDPKMTLLFALLNVAARE